MDAPLDSDANVAANAGGTVSVNELEQRYAFTASQFQL